MIKKRILVPERLRRPPATGWSWIDRRFLREHGEERDPIAQQLPLVQVLALPAPVVQRRPEPGQGLMLLGDIFRQATAAADKRRTTP